MGCNAKGCNGMKCVFTKSMRDRPRGGGIYILNVGSITLYNIAHSDRLQEPIVDGSTKSNWQFPPQPSDEGSLLADSSGSGGSTVTVLSGYYADRKSNVETQKENGNANKI